MADVFGLDGSKVGSVELPAVFGASVRRDLIKRAVVALQSHSLQPYGPAWLSGKNTSAFSFGAGRGLSKIPRVTSGSQRGRGSIVPQAVGGRRAHPPVPERVLAKKINKKEKVLATASAIAATSHKELVESRGHRAEGVLQFPLVVSDEIEGLKKTRDVKGALSKLGLDEDLIRAQKKSIRSGKGTRRGRKYRRKKGPLIVVSNPVNLKAAAENLAGVDVASAKDLNVVELAPGAAPARLTIYSQSALKDLGDRFKEVINHGSL